MYQFSCENVNSLSNSWCKKKKYSSMFIVKCVHVPNMLVSICGWLCGIDLFVKMLIVDVKVQVRIC